MGESILLAATIVGTVLLVVIVARYVISITALVNHFGAGKDCDLAKIGWGVRAIDKETAILPTGINELNSQLRAIQEGLMSIDKFVVVATTSQE